MSKKTARPTLKIHFTTDDLLKRVTSDELTKDDLLEFAAAFLTEANKR